MRLKVVIQRQAPASAVRFVQAIPQDKKTIKDLMDLILAKVLSKRLIGGDKEEEEFQQLNNEDAAGAVLRCEDGYGIHVTLLIDLGVWISYFNRNIVWISRSLK
jgi:hypothetical protein